MTGHHPVQTRFYQVGDGALRLRPAEIHGLGRQPESLLAGLVPQKAVSHLGAVSVADNDAISLFQQGHQVLAGGLHIAQLLFKRSLLSAP